MSINNIQLNSSLLSLLYPHSLVQDENFVATPAPPALPEKPATAVDSKNKPEWVSFGNNKQQTMVVVNYNGITHLPDDSLAFLTKMLGACKLSMADVCIVNTQNYQGLSGKDIIQHFKSRSVLLFGVTPEEFDLPVICPEFQVQPVAGTTYLYSPALETLQKNDVLKGKLWTSLKRIFGL